MGRSAAEAPVRLNKWDVGVSMRAARRVLMSGGGTRLSARSAASPGCTRANSPTRKLSGSQLLLLPAAPALPTDARRFAGAGAGPAARPGTSAGVGAGAGVRASVAAGTGAGAGMGPSKALMTGVGSAACT